MDADCGHIRPGGFETRNGGRYLEAHYVISLSEEGIDRPSNVIAFCAKDHRRVDFGSDWKPMQKGFKRIIAAHRAT